MATPVDDDYTKSEKTVSPVREIHIPGNPIEGVNSPRFSSP